MVMSKAVDELAKKTPGKRSLAMEAFSRAMRKIPAIIAENGGLDSTEFISQLRAAHEEEGSRQGVDILTGNIGDMKECGINESFKVKKCILVSATEAAEMILRVDDIIKCAPRQRTENM